MFGEFVVSGATVALVICYRGNLRSVWVFPTPGTARISSMTLVLRSSKDASSRMAERSQVPKMPWMSLMPLIFSRSDLTTCRTLRCSFGKTSIKIIALAGPVNFPFGFFASFVIIITVEVWTVNY